MDYKRLKTDYELFKEHALTGRYITPAMLEPLLNKRETTLPTVLGHSVNGLPVYGLKLGHGPLKVLVWSQMHGNESTTTKAVMDLINYFYNNQAPDIFGQITIFIIPMLNPDGALAYTRLNANNVDLNRDAQQLSQPESQILREAYKDFKPDYCLNLHGQRTIFGVGTPPRSAKLSFLSPAQDDSRKTTLSRKQGMGVIAAINTVLQEFIPNCVGRYDDGFNLNCVGDTLQAMDIPTILFEAGHINGDYQREEVRSLVFIALIKALETIAHTPENNLNYKPYFKIPENKKCFYDYVLRRIKLPERGLTDVAIHYKERLINGQVNFIPLIENIGRLNDFHGHKEYDCHGAEGQISENRYWAVGQQLDAIELSDGKTITFAPNLADSL